MPVTNFQSIVSAQSVGTADIDKLASSFAGLEGAIDRATQKSTELSKHPGFGEFAQKVKEGIEDPLGTIGSAAEKGLNAVGPLGAGIAAGVGIFAAYAGAVMEAAHSLGEYGHQIEETAIKTGLARTQVEGFAFAAKVNGQEVGIFDTGMRKLSQGIADTGSSGEKVRAGLAQLGVQFRTVTGDIRPTSDIFFQISEGLSRLPTAFDRNAAAVRIFGRSGIELVPTLLALRENVKYFEDHGLGANSAELARWGEYHKMMTEVGAVWDKLKRSMSEAIVAPVYIVVKQQTQFNPGRDRYLMSPTGGIGPDGQPVLNGNLTGWDSDIVGDAVKDFARKTEAQTHQALLPLLKSTDDMIASMLAPTTAEGRLTEAKSKLKDLQGNFRTGVLPGMQWMGEDGKLTSNEQIRQQVIAQRDAVAGLEAQIKATKDLTAAREHLADLDKRTADAALKARGLDGGLLGKYLGDYRAQETERADFLRKNGAAGAGGINADFASLENSTLITFLVNSRKEDSKKREEAWKKLMDETDKDAPDFVGAQRKGFEDSWDWAKGSTFFGAQYAGDFSSPEQQLRDARNKSTRGLGMYSLQATLGGVSEVDQVNALYSLKLKYNDEETAALLRLAATKNTQVEQESARSDALDQADQKAFEAKMEREQALFQMVVRQKEDFEQLAVGAFNSLRSGGFPKFLESQAFGLADKVVGNLAGMAWGDPTKGTGISHLIPHASDGSFLGSILKGTAFGADPAKAATDANTIATIENTAALRAVMSPAGGGGRAVPGWNGGFTPWTEAGPAAAGPDQFSPSEIAALAGDTGPNAGGGFSSIGPDSTAAVGSTASWTKYAGAGAALAAGGYGIYNGVRSGGAQGILTATGSGLAMAGSLMTLLDPVLKMAGPIGMIAGSALGLVSMFMGNPKQERQTDEQNTMLTARYTAPTASTYSVDRYGRGYDTDISGNMRPIIQIPVTVTAMDAKSFQDQMGNIVDVMATAMENNFSTRLTTAMKSSVGVPK